MAGSEMKKKEEIHHPKRCGTHSYLSFRFIFKSNIQNVYKHQNLQKYSLVSTKNTSSRVPSTSYWLWCLKPLQFQQYFRYRGRLVINKAVTNCCILSG